MSFDLKTRQNYPFDIKVKMSQNRIREWYTRWNGKVYVAFSGGKDSTVLLHLVRSLYPEVPAVFVDTGLEYPEIREFVKTVDNVIWLKPKMTFKRVIEKYGYPVVSKKIARYIYEVHNTKSVYLKNLRLEGSAKGNMGKISKKWLFLLDAPFPISSSCCDALKKSPLLRYQRQTKNTPFIGVVADESAYRAASYRKYGCNAFSKKSPSSSPMMFWKEGDVWAYIRNNNIPYSSIYDTGLERTGCMFCMFGVHIEKGKNRFQLMKSSHPKQYDYCINKLGCGKVLDYIGVKYD